MVLTGCFRPCASDQCVVGVRTVRLRRPRCAAAALSEQGWRLRTWGPGPETRACGGWTRCAGLQLRERSLPAGPAACSVIFDLTGARRRFSLCGARLPGSAPGTARRRLLHISSVGRAFTVSIFHCRKCFDEHFSSSSVSDILPLLTPGRQAHQGAAGEGGASVWAGPGWGGA